jgi:uncharacterized protein (TIGR01777 family)
MKNPRAKTVVITGVSGFIGRILATYLSEKGYEIIGLSRHTEIFKNNTAVNLNPWNPLELDGWEGVLKKADFFINLAGENVSALRWTSKKKKRIMDSRIQATKILIKAILEYDLKPDLFLQVSGIHFYGLGQNKSVDESNAGGEGFLASVSQQVEALTGAIDPNRSRTVLLRMGMVWGLTGGSFPKLLLPFKFFLGGSIGDGAQWISWIHHHDLCRAIEYIIREPNLAGPVNLSSPLPVQNLELTKALGKILRRPALFKIPAWMIKLFLGKMGEELLLSNLRVLPKCLLKHGFEFQFPDIKASLDDLLK